MPPIEAQANWTRGMLSASPMAPKDASPKGGIHWPLGMGERKPMLFVPSRTPAESLVLVVLLHGAGGGARDILPIMQTEAERRGWAVLVPQSAGASWDFIVHRFGPDVGMLDRALAATFELLPVDPSRIAISGFSDGGSYALTLGLINGGLFSSVLAFSPGFIGPGEWQGIPRIFISHGRQDSVLPIERCGRRIATALRQQNYPLHYEEFSGGHVVPTQVVTQAMDFHIEAGSTRDP